MLDPFAFPVGPVSAAVTTTVGTPVGTCITTGDTRVGSPDTILYLTRGRCFTAVGATIFIIATTRTRTVAGAVLVVATCRCGAVWIVTNASSTRSSGPTLVVATCRCGAVWIVTSIVVIPITTLIRRTITLWATVCTLTRLVAVVARSVHLTTRLGLACAGLLLTLPLATLRSGSAAVVRTGQALTFPFLVTTRCATTLGAVKLRQVNGTFYSQAFQLYTAFCTNRFYGYIWFNSGFGHGRGSGRCSHWLGSFGGCGNGG